MKARLALVVPAVSRMATRIVGQKLPRLLAAGWDVHAIAPQPPATVARDLRDRIHVGDARSALAKLQPALVHFELSAGHAATVERAVAVATLGGSDLVEVPTALPAVRALHCYTQSEAGAARSHDRGLDIRVIAPVLRDVAPAPTPRDRGELRILVWAPLHWTQGLEVVLEAMADLVGKGVAARMRLVGKGNALVPVGFARHQLGLEHCVDMIRDDAEADHLAWADVVLHLPVVDGISPDLLEAQAQGIPAVVSDAIGLPDLIAHEETGIVVPRRSPKAAADALARIARDPALAQRLATAAQRRARDAFSPAATVAAFDAWYQELLTAEPPGRGSHPRRS